MSKIEANLKEVLSSVKTIVKNIKHKRDLILTQIADRECVSKKQLSDLLNTYVNQILNNSDQTSDEELARGLLEDPHKQLSDDITAGNLLETQLRQRIKTLEESLQMETKDKQRIESYCEKILNNCQINDQNHKKCVEDLNHIIENLKKSESELKLEINDLKNNSSVKPKSDPLIALKGKAMLRSASNKKKSLKSGVNDRRYPKFPEKCRTYVCNTLNHNYSSKNNYLKQHTSGHQKKKFIYRCDECPKESITEAAIRQHIKDMHK